MEYGIHPMIQINEAYTFRYPSQQLALEAAKAMSEKYHCEVLVYEIIGSYKSIIVWEEV